MRSGWTCPPRTLENRATPNQTRIRRMKRFRLSPALVISLIALFVALGGTSYAAVALKIPKNSVGTPQLKNGAVTAGKLNASAIAALKSIRTLPSGVTETGDWGFGTDSAGGVGAASEMWQVTSFSIPLA